MRVSLLDCPIDILSKAETIGLAARARRGEQRQWGAPSRQLKSRNVSIRTPSGARGRTICRSFCAIRGRLMTTLRVCWRQIHATSLVRMVVADQRAPNLCLLQQLDR